MSIKRPPQRVPRCVGPVLRQQAPEGLSQGAIETDFSGGVITSNGGVTLLQRADARLDLTRASPPASPTIGGASWWFTTSRPWSCSGSTGSPLAHEDLNDHEDLRRDPALQAVAGRPRRDGGTALRWRARAP